MRVSISFTWNRVTWATCTCTCWVSTLAYEARNNTVECNTVIKILALLIFLKFSTVFGASSGKKFQVDFFHRFPLICILKFSYVYVSFQLSQHYITTFMTRNKKESDNLDTSFFEMRKKAR